MPTIETAKYNASQQELYTISRQGWKNCMDHLSDFTAFSPRYTAAYCESCEAEIVAAQALPSDIARSGLSEDNRILLTRAADAGLLKWQSLKRYIIEAYDEKRSVTMLKIAGQSRYTDASRYNWQSINAVLTEGSKFITSNTTELVANDNMPLGFGADFDAAKDAFETLQAKFFGGVTDTNTGSQNKIIANNSVFAKLSKMLNDGQIIFTSDFTNKQKFIFNNLKGIISGINQAGLRGYVTDVATGLPVADATVATANNIYTAITDVEGRFNIKGMAANDYVLTIGAVGYSSQTITITVKTGTTSSVNVILDGLLISV